MSAHTIRKAAVLGSGTMGRGIAQLLAMAECNVTMVDVSDEILQKAMEKIKWSLNKFVEKKRISVENAEATLARISTATSCEQAAIDIDLAVEAVPENLELKKRVFSIVDSIAPPHAILASNTSTLSITEIGKSTRSPEKVAGMHFFNPPQLMALVEVIKGEKTSQETLNVLVDFAKKLGKTPVVVRKDVRGFIVNRILGAVFNEAFWTCYRGEAAKEQIDSSLKYNGGFPMGWFELADFIGLDIVYEVGKILHEAYGERMKPCLEVIEPLVRGHKFGQKTGVGFYDWNRGRPRIPFNLLEEYDVERSWAVAVNEAAWLLHDDAASPKDIDTGMKLGAYWPSGPCEYADRVGLDVMPNRLEELHTKYCMDLYKPCPLLKNYVVMGWTGEKVGRGFYC